MKNRFVVECYYMLATIENRYNKFNNALNGINCIVRAQTEHNFISFSSLFYYVNIGALRGQDGARHFSTNSGLRLEKIGLWNNFVSATPRLMFTPTQVGACRYVCYVHVCAV